MKSQSWFKKALHIYLFNLLLVVGQITAIGGPLPAYAVDAPVEEKSIYPPGFTKEDFKLVADRNAAAEANNKREQERNQGVVEVEKDVSSSKECRTYAANDERRMNDLVEYRTVTGAQGYDEICRLRQQLSSQTGGPSVQCGNTLELVGDSTDINRNGSLSEAETKYSADVTDQIDNIDDGAWEEKKNAVNARDKKAKEEVQRLRALVPEKRARYESARSRCEADHHSYCSRDERNEISRLKVAYESSVAGLRAAEKEAKAAQHAVRTYGQAVVQQEGKVTGAGDDMASNDAKMAESDALSGVENTATGAGGGLTGPVYETNEALKKAIDRYTSNAAAFAEEKIAESQRLEFLNANNGDYKYYEQALKDIDPNTRGGKMSLSNLDVMAMASASIKKLKCSPQRKHDSKAYHIFRAASATYIAASIGDNDTYNETMACLKDENFNTVENNDQQFESAEKALNSHTLIVDTMCTEVAPDPDNIPQINGVDVLPRERIVKLKEICDAAAGTTCAPGQENGCAPRSRETALEMYTTALMIAQQELTDKRQLVATAEANVAKGKNKIKATTKSIAIAIALDILWKVIAQTDLGTGLGMNASSPPCFCAGMGFVAKSFWDNAKAAFFYAKYIYYGVQLVRWKNFTAKWERKLEEAREHTHLACNEDKAIALAGTHKNFADKTKKDAVDAHNAAKDSVYKSIQKEGASGSMDKKTGYLILPDGISNDEKQFLVENYLAKYMKFVGKTAMNIVFPSAFATDTQTGSNNETATDNVMGDTTTSAKALGMTMGSSSFYQFVISQNDHWKEQAFNADIKHQESGYVHNDNPIMYCDEGGGSNCIKEEVAGMPTPETRVRLIAQTVEIVTENISGMLEQLDIGVNQRDQYVMLLNQMREAMKLGEQGLDTQVEEKPVTKASACMAQGLNGDFEIDKDCQCALTNNCASLKYGNFGEFSPGVLADGEQAAKNFADSSLSGKLKKANVAAGDLSGNSDAVRRRIRLNYKNINKLRAKTGRSKLNFSRAAKRSIQKRRQQAFAKYKKLFPKEYKFEKVRGGLASFSGNLDMDGATTRSDRSALASLGNSNSNTGSSEAIGTGGKGSIGAAKPKGFQGLDFDFEDEDNASDVNYDATDDKALAALNGSSSAGSNDSNQRYKHERTLYGDGEKNSSGINKDTKRNIFGIISSRYKKTAFPLFLGDQSMR